MQNNKQKIKEFSPPCVDNSTKNQEKSNQNQSLSGVTDKNAEKTPNFQENSDVLPASAVDLPVEGVSDINSSSNVSKTDGFEQKAAESQENADKKQENASENQENAGESKVILTYESQIERDFNDFSIMLKNILEAI